MFRPYFVLKGHIKFISNEIKRTFWNTYFSQETESVLPRSTVTIKYHMKSLIKEKKNKEVEHLLLLMNSYMDVRQAKVMNYFMMHLLIVKMYTEQLHKSYEKKKWKWNCYLKSFYFLTGVITTFLGCICHNEFRFLKKSYFSRNDHG